MPQDATAPPPDSPHLLIPLAASHAPGCQQQLPQLVLPHLARLLPALSLVQQDSGQETDFSLPHERALARHLGLPADASGSLPWAAWQALQQRLPGAAGQAWAYVTPCQWQIGADSVVMTDPDRLPLQEAESRALLDILAPWFAQDGITLHYQQPTRWLASGAPLAGLACAALERVTGRDVRPWLPDIAQARSLHRLHSEMQMLLYTHPFNEQRADRGQPPINAFWLHGAGPLTAAPPPDTPPPDMPGELLEAALREDWPAWARAWQALDAGPLARLAAQARAGQPVRLTLCGERSALHWQARPRGLWARIKGHFGQIPLSDVGNQL